MCGCSLIVVLLSIEELLAVGGRSDFPDLPDVYAIVRSVGCDIYN